MTIIAGTTEGIYRVENGSSRKTCSSGTVRDLARIGDQIFAGTADGVYRSDDTGNTWRPSGLPDYEVWQIRGDSSGRLYASTAPAALFRSDDHGNTWQELEAFANVPEATDWCIPVDPPVPARARALVVDREDSKRLWVGVEVGGLLRTNDGGKQWSCRLPGNNPDLHMIFAHPVRPGVLFVSTGYGRQDGLAEMVEGNAGVFRSEDYGQTWHYTWHGITPRYSRPMCIDHRAPHAITVASAPTAFSRFDDPDGAGAMLYQSEDNGDSWRSLCDDAHSPSRANIHGLALDPDTSGGVIVGTDTGEVWRISNDAKWSQAASGLPWVSAVIAAHGIK